MNRLYAKDGHLHVSCTKNSFKNINVDVAKKLIRTGQRMIEQNDLNMLIIDIDSKLSVTASALKLVQKVLEKTCNLPVVLVSS